MVRRGSRIAQHAAIAGATSSTKHPYDDLIVPFWGVAQPAG
jgi:hypothetical protein